MAALQIVMAAAALHWVGVSITTSKTSEDMYQHYFKSEETCWTSEALPGDREDRVCIPVPALPEELFEAQRFKCAEDAERYAWSETYRQPMRDACLRD